MKSFFLQVKEVIKETSDTVSLSFWHPINEQIKYKAGQFITITVPTQDGKKVKIQLLDPFFGAILSQILANPNTIKIRQGGNDKLHVQKMGDIVIQDPSTGKIFRIPFPIIFYSIALDFTTEFTSEGSMLNPSEKKVKVVRNTDEYLYMFYDYGLESLEYISKDKNLQAKAKLPTIGQELDNAMEAIEKENPELKNVLPKVFGKPNLDKSLPALLMSKSKFNSVLPAFNCLVSFGRVHLPVALICASAVFKNNFSIFQSFLSLLASNSIFP
jgi:hypothetical protein